LVLYIDFNHLEHIFHFIFDDFSSVTTAQRCLHQRRLQEVMFGPKTHMKKEVLDVVT